MKTLTQCPLTFFYSLNRWRLKLNVHKTFFSIKVFFNRHWRFIGQQGKGGNHLYSSLPLPSTDEHSDVYMQLCTWDDYHIYLFTPLVTTRLLFDEIYHFIELPFDWQIDYGKLISVCLLDELILDFLLQQSDITNRCIRIRNDYHPCFTKESTNQVRWLPQNGRQKMSIPFRYLMKMSENVWFSNVFSGHREMDWTSTERLMYVPFTSCYQGVGVFCWL